MGWELPKHRYYLSMIRFWNNIFERILQIFTPDTWGLNILVMLETINLTDHFGNCDEVDITEVQHRLQDLMNLEWSAILPSKPKLQSCSFFKHIISAGPHATSNLSKGKRSLISQLRVGILPLEIESV